MEQIINCVVCKKEIIATNGDQLRKKFCSKKCRNWYYNRNMKGKQNFCIDCGEQISLIAKYCMKCKIIHQDYWNEKNPRYNKGESAGYIKRLADKSVIDSGRSLNLCEKCSKEETNPRKIQPHHKDRNRKNNNPNNLIVLCKSCHVKTHHNDYKTERKCCFCGQLFMSKKKNHTFCSTKCYMKNYNKKPKNNTKGD